MTKNKILATVALLAVTVGATGCRTAGQTGSLLGAGIGTALGSAIGYHNKNRTAGMLIGGTVGALAGYALGNEVDKEQRGSRYEGDPRYEPGARPRRYRESDGFDDDAPPRERVIYRERYIYEDDRDCEPCR